MKLKVIIIALMLFISGCQIMVVPFEYDAPLKTIHAKEHNSYFIDQDNVLMGWGQNIHFQFGKDSQQAAQEPKMILEDVVDFKANFGQYLALKSNGSLWEWGSNRRFTSSFDEEDHVLKKELENVKKIWTNSDSLTYILMDDNSLWYIGWDECKIIDETMANSHVSGVVLTKVLDDVVDLAVSWKSSNAIAMKKDGSFWAWGNKENHTMEEDVIQYLLKDFDETCITTPMEVEIPYSMSKMVYTSGTVYFIDEHDVLWGWGNNDNHRINNTTQTYIKEPVIIMEDVIDVQSTAFCTFALLKDQSLWGWSNRLGCLGLNNEEPVTAPTKLMEEVKMFSADITHTLVVLEDDTFWGWGTNKYSEVGGPNRRQHKVPIKIGEPFKPK